MKNHKGYIKKIAAELLIASMMTVNVSSLALADTETPIVEITDYGPVGAAEASDNNISLVPSGASSVSESGASNTTTISVAGPTAGTASSDAGTTGTTQAQTESTTGNTAANVETTVTSTTETAAAGTGTVDATVASDVSTDLTAASVSESAHAGTSVAATSGTETVSTSNDPAAATAASTIGTNFFQTSGGNSFLKTSLTAHPEINANFAILVDADSNLVVAEKNSDTRMYPASMTKVMTLLVACEHITNLSDEVEITSDIVKYVNDNDASNCGFKAGEKVTVQDLLYGLILPSGADAALALVRYIAGSEEQFVNLMNQKAQELGIAGTTHYTNSTGLYNDNHYTTAGDMALVMKYAAANSYASAILSTRTYTTKPNNKRSTGITFSNLFLKRIDGQATGGTALMAKTGYVSKAGNCAVSCFTGASGKHYICVTGKTSGAWNVVYAHRDLFKEYAK